MQLPSELTHDLTPGVDGRASLWALQVHANRAGALPGAVHHAGASDQNLVEEESSCPEPLLACNTQQKTSKCMNGLRTHVKDMNLGVLEKQLCDLGRTALSSATLAHGHDVELDSQAGATMQARATRK